VAVYYRQIRFAIEFRLDVEYRDGNVPFKSFMSNL